MDISCPQCYKVITDPSLRLVQDSCGHKKCRGCLLNDEHECKMCVAENGLQNNVLADQGIELKYKAHDFIPSTGGSEESLVRIGNENQFTELRSVPFLAGFEFIKLQNAPVAEEEEVVELQSTLIENEKQNAQQHQEVFADANTNILKRPYATSLIPSHVTLDKDTYTCNICSRSFKSKGYAKFHKYCANGGKKPFQCKSCTRTFIHLSTLEVHELIHSNKKPFTCDICKKSFRQRSKLTRHKLLHNDKRLYKCENCEKAFNSKESLASHVIAIHTSEKKFGCSVCNSRFNNSSNFKKHLVTHIHETPHMCDQCGKRFKSKVNLSLHKRIHSIKTYRCSHCTKLFSYAKDLQRHELIHLDVKAYACGFCNIEFSRKDNLERHMRNLHPGKKVSPLKKEFPTKCIPKNSLEKTITSNQILPAEVPYINHYLPKPIIEIIRKEVNNPVLTQDIPDNTPLLQRLDVVRDRPNAVTVIRAPPGILSKNRDELREKGKSVINAPLKLALKTNEFKSHYNIQSRNYENLEPEQQRPSNNQERPIENQPTEERRVSLSSFTAPKGSAVHYETSFEHKKHAIIKNIKFKLPAKYNTNFKAVALNTVNNFSMHSGNSENILGETSNNYIIDDVVEENGYLNNREKYMLELKNDLTQTRKIEDALSEMSKQITTDITAATSVIVNTSNTAESVHWRRRTAQNLNAKLLQ